MTTNRVNGINGSSHDSSRGHQSSGLTSPQDLLRVIFRHKWKTSGFFFFTIATVIATILFWPRTYVSEAKLFVRLGRESIGVDPTATTGETVRLSDTRESEINSIMEILRSREIASAVVDRLGASTVLGKNLTSANSDSTSWLSGIRSAVGGVRAKLSLDPVSEQERAITAVMSSLKVAKTDDSDVISVSYYTASPVLARQIASQVINDYLQTHARVHRTSGSREFFMGQSELLRNQLARAYEELRDAKNKTGILSIEGQRDGLQQQLNWVDSTLLQTELGHDGANAEIIKLEALQEEIPRDVRAEEVHGFPQAVADQMQQRLHDLVIAEKELSIRLRERHPDLVAARQSVEEARSIVENESPSRTQWTTKINPAWDSVQVELVRQRARADSLAAQRDTLVQQRQSLMNKLLALNAEEATITQLEEHVTMRETQYRDYQQKFEQVRVDEALAAESITNVNVVQPATLVERPVRPQKTILLAAGLFLAAAGAIVLAFTSEFLDQTLKTPAELENALQLPVLVTIPHNQTSSASLS